MVRNDRDSLRVFGFIYIGLALMVGLLPLIALFRDLSSSPSFLAKDFLNSPVDSLIVLCFACLVCGVIFLIQAPRWKLVNYRRQMAASLGFAARVPLATPHPLPNIGALPLPFTIKLRPAWPLFLIPVGGIAGLFFIIQQGFIFPGGVVLGWIAGTCIGLTFWIFHPQKIEVTQDGLIVRHPFYDWRTTEMGGGNGKRTILWSEARLFAVRDGKPGAPASHYELSSPYVVVKWQRLRHPCWWALYRPASAFGEYDAQMDALIAVISGYTGLPLYDVR